MTTVNIRSAVAPQPYEGLEIGPRDAQLAAEAVGDEVSSVDPAAYGSHVDTEEISDFCDRGERLRGIDIAISHGITLPASSGRGGWW